MRIQAPELIQAIVRRYGIVGSSGPDTLAPEIVPVSVVDYLPDATTQAQRRCGFGVKQAGAAAQYSQVQLLNPTGSGILCFLDFWQVRLESAQPWVVGFYDTALPTAGEARMLDRRLVGTVPACLVKQDDGVSKVVGAASQFFYESSSFRGFNGPGYVILDEGTGVVFECLTVDIDIYVSCLWWEQTKKRTD